MSIIAAFLVGHLIVYKQENSINPINRFWPINGCLVRLFKNQVLIIII